MYSLDDILYAAGEVMDRDTQIRLRKEIEPTECNFESTRFKGDDDDFADVESDRARHVGIGRALQTNAQIAQRQHARKK